MICGNTPYPSLWAGEDYWRRGEQLGGVRRIIGEEGYSYYSNYWRRENTIYWILIY